MPQSDMVLTADERVGIREYETAIRTYRQLVVEAAGC